MSLSNVSKHHAYFIRVVAYSLGESGQPAAAVEMGLDLSVMASLDRLLEHRFLSRFLSVLGS